MHGVGRQKLDDFGEEFLGLIRTHCESTGLAMDVEVATALHTRPVREPTDGSLAAFKHFDDGLSVVEVAQVIARAESTVRDYLTDYIQHRKISDPSRWVDEATAGRIQQAIDRVGNEKLKPIFIELEEAVSYDDIRIVAECRRNQSTPNEDNGESTN
jgi:ATP-dependent DNA helicase RecQ